MATVTRDNTFDEMMNRTKDLTTDATTVESTATTFSLEITETTRAQRGFIWEPKEGLNKPKQPVTTEQKIVKPHRGGIFKKDNILKFGLPRPTTGPRRGGIYKKKL